jgi:hypothetical protein
LIIANRKGSDEFWHFLFPFIPLLTAMPKDSVRIADLVAIGDQLNSADDGLYFRPQSDGAAHWVVRLQLETATILSITALDDRSDTAIAAFLLVSFLKGFEKEIQHEIIAANKIGRNEVTISVVNQAQIPNDIRSYIPPGMSSEPCVVTRPTSPASDDAMPTIVMCRPDISDRWEADMGKASAAQILFALTLVEIVFQLFKGEVEEETLRPKILKVIRKTIS